MDKKSIGDYIAAIAGMTAFMWLWVAVIYDYLIIGD